MWNREKISYGIFSSQKGQGIKQNRLPHRKEWKNKELSERTSRTKWKEGKPDEHGRHRTLKKREDRNTTTTGGC